MLEGRDVNEVAPEWLARALWHLREQHNRVEGAPTAEVWLGWAVVQSAWPMLTAAQVEGSQLYNMPVHVDINRVWSIEVR